MAPQPRPGRGEGVELLARDSLQEQANQGHGGGGESLDLSGAIDILPELKSGVPPPQPAVTETGEVIIEVVDEEPTPFMAAFFNEVKGVKNEMASIRSSMQQVKDLQTKIITEVSQQKSKEYTEQLDDLLHQTSRKAKLVKEHLFKLKQEGEQTMGENKDSSEARTHANMQGALTRKFVEIMGEFQEIQSNYKKHLRDRVARQVKVANPAATEAEIEKAVDEGGEGIFTDKLMSRADQTALNAYADVQSKHEELIKLESSIREVHQLFLDMAILVEQQGELLDNIEDIVSHASTYVESGVVQLEKAKDLQKKMRKKMCFLVICFGIMALILFAWLSSFVPFL